MLGRRSRLILYRYVFQVRVLFRRVRLFSLESQNLLSGLLPPSTKMNISLSTLDKVGPMAPDLWKPADQVPLLLVLLHKGARNLEFQIGRVNKLGAFRIEPRNATVIPGVEPYMLR